MPQAFQTSYRPRTIVKLLDSTSAIDVYTCPDNTVGNVVLLFIGNTSSSAVDVTITKYDASAATTTDLVTKSVSGKDGYFFIKDNGYLNLREGDILRFTAGSANDITVTLTVEETFDNTARG